MVSPRVTGATERSGPLLERRWRVGFGTVDVFGQRPDGTLDAEPDELAHHKVPVRARRS